PRPFPSQKIPNPQPSRTFSKRQAELPDGGAPTALPSCHRRRRRRRRKRAALPLLPLLACMCSRPLFQTLTPGLRLGCGRAGDRQRLRPCLSLHDRRVDLSSAAAAAAPALGRPVVGPRSLGRGALLPRAVHGSRAAVDARPFRRLIHQEAGCEG
uniref:Uncharacterized protein n=1 Tax=Aegilops tauschii subsp. strangulata TaxID=200361 RepID=A0A453HID4_AEGTS